MTQSPQRGQTAPPTAPSDVSTPSSEFGSVTTQRSSSSSTTADTNGHDTERRDNDHGVPDGRDTASWENSPFANGVGSDGSGQPPSSSSSSTTSPSLPTTSDRPGGSGGIAGAGGATFADSTTGSLRTEPATAPSFSAPAHTGTPLTAPPTGTPAQAGPPPGAPVEAPPPAGRGATNNRAAKGSRSRGPRRARLQLRHINPWTVLKFSCVLSIALFFVWLIVVGVLFGILDGAGIIGKVNDTITTINGAGSNAPITAGIVFGGAAIIGVVNIVLFIALSTVGSLVYNLCADLVGGIEITLSER